MIRKKRTTNTSKKSAPKCEAEWGNEDDRAIEFWMLNGEWRSGFPFKIHDSIFEIHKKLNMSIESRMPNHKSWNTKVGEGEKIWFGRAIDRICYLCLLTRRERTSDKSWKSCCRPNHTKCHLASTKLWRGTKCRVPERFHSQNEYLSERIARNTCLAEVYLANESSAKRWNPSGDCRM